MKWYLKQLLPLTYVTEYGCNGGRMVSIWKMWMGKCYGIRHWAVAV